ncbi:MAG: tRNA (guanine(10)-N(2))-dimethyltransferase [Candidatus Hydrothermarchaeales archaeon]
MEKWKTIKEGKTKLIIPKEGAFGENRKGREKKAPVFYNPKMELNRDLCCSVLKELSKEKEIIFADLLAGSGAKGIRVANETKNRVHLNDANPDAYEVIKKNAKLNNLDVTISNLEANKFLQDNFHAFDFIDIDPFGTPAPFLDNALMTLKKGGYLGVTATDTAPLCGVYPKACYRKYGAVPLRSEICHEMGLRILIGHIARTSAKYSKGMKILLTYYQEHYFRVYASFLKGKENANASLENIGFVYYCKNCLNREHENGFHPSDKKCSCGSKFFVAGPLWLGSLNDKDFLKRVLNESAYLKSRSLDRLVSMLIEEADSFFYFDTHRIAKNLHLELKPIDKIIENLKSEGFMATRTHFSPTSIKTDAKINDLKKAFF